MRADRMLSPFVILSVSEESAFAERASSETRCFAVLSMTGRKGALMTRMCSKPAPSLSGG